VLALVCDYLSTEALRAAMYQVPQTLEVTLAAMLATLGVASATPGILLLQIAYEGTKEKGREIKRLLQAKYKMCDLGVVKRFLGIEIERGEDRNISICQQAYIDTILKRFGQLDAKSAKTPLDHQVDLANTNCEDKTANRKEYLTIVSLLMYAALGTKPDIAFSVTALSRYNVEPLEMYLTTARRVLRYLKMISELCVHY